MKILFTNFHTHHGGGLDTEILALIRNLEIGAYAVCPETRELYQKLPSLGFKNLFPLNIASKPTELCNIDKDYKRLTRFVSDYKIDMIDTKIRLTKFDDCIMVVSKSIYNILAFLHDNEKTKLIKMVLI